jgi:hypothetical protein
MIKIEATLTVKPRHDKLSVHTNPTPIQLYAANAKTPKDLIPPRSAAKGHQPITTNLGSILMSHMPQRVRS